MSPVVAGDSIVITDTNATLVLRPVLCRIDELVFDICETPRDVEGAERSSLALRQRRRREAIGALTSAGPTTRTQDESHNSQRL
jgi:hypothetical protein